MFTVHDNFYQKFLAKLYLSLPTSLKQQCQTGYHGLLNIIAQGSYTFIWPSKQDKKPININDFEQMIYAQEGEDGIIKIIFHTIGVSNKYCVEFGVDTGKVCNTRYLIDKEQWQFLQMDCKKELHPSIKNEYITAENINGLFEKYNVPKEFDLLSIDIDFNDYWIWKALKNYSPRVVIIEYNASIPPNESRVVNYNPQSMWDHTDYFGASLLALTKLGQEKGYTLIGCESRGINAFFVRTDLVKDKFVKKSIEEYYKRPKYGLKENGHFIGHRHSQKIMEEI